jgi:hypothetical protein
MSVNRATAGVGVVALVLGAGLLIAAGGLALWIAGVALLGLSGIAFVALVFLLVGESEERDRLRNPRG